MLELVVKKHKLYLQIANIWVHCDGNPEIEFLTILSHIPRIFCRIAVCHWPLLLVFRWPLKMHISLHAYLNVIVDQTLADVLYAMLLWPYSGQIVIRPAPCSMQVLAFCWISFLSEIVFCYKACFCFIFFFFFGFFLQLKIDLCWPVRLFSAFHMTLTACCGKLKQNSACFTNSLEILLRKKRGDAAETMVRARDGVV